MLSDDLVKGARGAANFLGLSPKQIYALVERGHLPTIRKGRMMFFRKSELEAAFRSESAA